MAGETSVSLFRDILLNNTIPKLQETLLHLIKKETFKAENLFFANDERLQTSNNGLSQQNTNVLDQTW